MQEFWVSQSWTALETDPANYKWADKVICILNCYNKDLGTDYYHMDNVLILINHNIKQMWEHL